MTPFTKNSPKRKNAQFFKKIFEKWEVSVANGGFPHGPTIFETSLKIILSQN